VGGHPLSLLLLSKWELLAHIFKGLEADLVLNSSASQAMLIDGKRIALSPGMNITAEIKTGQRRIIEFLLSPVQRAGSESLRER
jgi:hypothetical protein